MQKNFLNKQRLLAGSIVLACMLIFLSFGLFHLSKFETVDEHFWKYERIPKYWLDGILKHNIQKTYINDKPGVATAIISGLGLPFIGNPQEHRIRDAAQTASDSYTLYDSEKTERINFALRFPLLLFNTLLLLCFFWLAKKLTDSLLLASLFTFFIASSPILLGISQIINPDTLLWSFGSIALLSYFAFLRSSEKKYLLATILFTGLSLLAKYTAGILLALYPLSFLAFLIFEKNSTPETIPLSKKIFSFLRDYAFLWLGSILIFSLGMPAVFAKFKYLYRGTFLSPSFKPLLLPVAFFLLILAADAFFFKSKFFQKFLELCQKFQKPILRLIALTMLLFFSFLFINSWFGQKFIPLDNIREEAYFEKELLFPMFSQDLGFVKILKEIAVELYPLPFSISPVVLFFLIFLWGKIALGKKINFTTEVAVLTAMPLIFAIGSLFSGILLNPRYLIMIYVPLFFLGTLGFFEFIQSLPFLQRKNALAGLLAIIIFSGLFSLWSSKPFYFNYMNDLLPEDQLITDSWGYGSYEAAQYLNSLPGAENLVIWSDRSAICQFIKGKCIRDYKIDLTKTKPDYFVFCRRGQIRHQFQWKKPELAKHPVSYYYTRSQSAPDWQMSINGRSENFVKIVKAEE